MSKPTIPRPDSFGTDPTFKCNTCEDQRFVHCVSATPNPQTHWDRCPDCRPEPEVNEGWSPPSRYKDAKLTDFVVHANHEQAEIISINPDRAYYIHGPVGSGKTHATAAQAIQIQRDNGTVIVWCNGYTLGELNRGSGGIMLVKGMHLFIDDLDKLYQTEYQASRVWGLIDTCFIDNIPLTITANQSMETFCKAIDEKSQGKSMGASLLHRLDTMCKELKFG